MEGAPGGEVRIELRRGTVSIPSSSCDDLLEQLENRHALSDVPNVREAFLAAGTEQPVSLTDPQKLGLRNAISFWVVEKGGNYDELPAGIHALRDALQADLAVVGIPDEPR
jgi:hypothetical protein